MRDTETSLSQGVVEKHVPDLKVKDQGGVQRHLWDREDFTDIFVSVGIGVQRYHWIREVQKYFWVSKGYRDICCAY